MEQLLKIGNKVKIIYEHEGKPMIFIGKIVKEWNDYDFIWLKTESNIEILPTDKIIKIWLLNK